MSGSGSVFRQTQKAKREAARKEHWEQLLGKFADTTMLPRDTVTGYCCVTVTGQNEIVIENYKGILNYCPERITILTKQCQVEVIGRHLEILYYAQEEMKIKGKIESICYKNR